MQVHRRRKGKVRGLQPRVGFLDDTVVDLARQHVLIAHGNIRVGLLKAEDHGFGEWLVERGIDDQRPGI
ncbi:hypothetical protein D3C87_1878030 [compost metagenome]